MDLQHRISLLLLIFSSLLELTSGNFTAHDCDRRCLAQLLIDKKLLSPPQNENCTTVVNITSIQYETLSFDTKDMQMNSRIKVNMEWMDPDLAWTKNYSFPTIVMPVDKIWTPGIVLDNAIETTVEPYTNDVQVRRDGTVDHAVVLFTSVSCEINLFNYPFVTGECPVAINGWSQKSCSLNLQISDNVSLVGGSGGEWQTLSVIKVSDTSQPESRNYLHVTLSINPFGAFVTLILPSALILLADLVSFALPFEGGERNSFKVTLVLSFTMFLLILNDHLPNGGNCSPLLHYHFSFCLVCLVLSMLISIVLTRLSVDGSILPCRRSKVHPSNSPNPKNDCLDKEKDMGSEISLLQKIVFFLEDMDKGDDNKESNMAFAYFMDKCCFCFFLIIYIIYAIILICVTQADICKVNNLDFWDNSKPPDYSFDYSYSYYYYYYQE
ncbi:5-hydroxytryptamine receptor 3A-like [Myxocyprinus asiaticus]|uniref:5-hydroxytryptamine receptor 3A-like n=1 Tax=Myxocyprinus asiaticus TaxID=70543 RepID=UPI0022230D60|nr:5-hydroxytryptamine receptor 3A-like [Myxocyprinus asiaticus]